MEMIAYALMIENTIYTKSTSSASSSSTSSSAGLGNQHVLTYVVSKC